MTRSLRIRILSDLHNEFSPCRVPDADADVVVLAGDIDLGKKGLRWAAATFPTTPVVYVAGNHEYYGRAIPKLTDELAGLAERTTVSFLERAEATIGDVRFLGCTLWTDFRITGDQQVAILACEAGMTDFRKIRLSPSFRRIHARDQATWHEQAVAWLRSELGKDPSRTVVVTHHAPSARSLDHAFSGDLISAAYASDLGDLISEFQPAAWIHGHTHHCVDYTIGRTRVVSNQRGYPREPVAAFDPYLIVEL